MLWLPTGQDIAGKPKILNNSVKARFKLVNKSWWWNGASVGHVGKRRIPLSPSACLIWWRSLSSFLSILHENENNVKIKQVKLFEWYARNKSCKDEDRIQFYEPY